MKKADEFVTLHNWVARALLGPMHPRLKRWRLVG
jgi:hypothetical protein